ncbi:hypothetical protein [Cryptosporangium sp. NPDC051539]|uniref:hypothetical protein n=1 Tax=Cryptosporangium sp. NPDC051539 TaxID=3363962 RepID=UPI003792BAC7
MTITDTERRLSAALSARAESITAADLRPPAPPTRGHRSPASKTRWLFTGMALAAAFAAVAVLVLVTQVRESPIRPSHQPSGRPAASPTPAASEPARPSPSETRGPAVPQSPADATPAPPSASRAGRSPSEAAPGVDASPVAPVPTTRDPTSAPAATPSIVGSGPATSR